MIKIFPPWATAHEPKRPLVNGCSCCCDSYFCNKKIFNFEQRKKILATATFFHSEWYGLGFGYEYTVARGTLMIQRNITYWHNCHHHHNHYYHYNHTLSYTVRWGTFKKTHDILVNHLYLVFRVPPAQNKSRSPDHCVCGRRRGKGWKPSLFSPGWGCVLIWTNLN